MKNILILNAGTRNRLIRYFKENLKGQSKVIATDNYYLAPAIYEADQHIVTKRWDESGYWDEIMEICRENQVGLILSLVDSELETLACHRPVLEKMGILVNLADKKTIHGCFDKYSLLQFLEEKGYPVVKTYISFEESQEALRIGEISFPLFVKPRYGSGSVGTQKVDDIKQLELICKKEQDILVQEFMGTQELGVDVFVDLISEKVVSVFAKKKLKMRAGETDKSVSYINERLFEMIIKFSEEFGLRGANDIDVFERNGDFYISEVNPRFGGGYLHAYECGENFPGFLINNMKGIENEPSIGNYEEKVYMMKYFDIQILKAGD